MIFYNIAFFNHLHFAFSIFLPCQFTRNGSCVIINMFSSPILYDVIQPIIMLTCDPRSLGNIITVHKMYDATCYTIWLVIPRYRTRALFMELNYVQFILYAFMLNAHGRTDYKQPIFGQLIVSKATLSQVPPSSPFTPLHSLSSFWLKAQRPCFLGM